jgi:hypothetical protein
MQEITVKPEAPPGAGEVHWLACQLVDAFQNRVNRFKHEQGLSTPEAVAKAENPCAGPRALTIMLRAPEQVTWGELEEIGPERAARLFGEIKQAARDELRDGCRAGGALMGPDAVPYQLARFLAIRAELADGWQPRNGVERQIIDQMAQAQAWSYHWQEQLAHHSITGLDLIEQLGAMVDRFNRVFLRLLRALQDLRRQSSAHERPSRRAGACRQATSNHVQSRFARLN